jgi:hypothetical protein
VAAILFSGNRGPQHTIPGIAFAYEVPFARMKPPKPEISL